MRILILGATGAAGGSPLDMALVSARVSEVRTLTRRPIAEESRKLVRTLHSDLFDYSAVATAFAGLILGILIKSLL